MAEERARRTRSAAADGMQAHPPSENHLLASLPAAAVARLRQYMQLIQLERKEILFRAHEPLRHVYFPATAVVSFVSRLESGEQLEVGLVGRDGLTGISFFPGIATMSCDGVVQIAGVAHRISADTLRQQMLSDEALYFAISRYMQVLLVRSMQMSVCNTFHSAEQRCIRWLLSVNDLSSGDEIPLTHELIATMLGTHRPTMTQALRHLHKIGLIAERRGSVVLRDREGLESACCECYAVMREEHKRLLGW